MKSDIPEDEIISIFKEIDENVIIFDNLINWQERVIKMDPSPIYKQLEWLREKVKEFRADHFVGREEVIEKYNRKLLDEYGLLEFDLREVIDRSNVQRFILMEKQRIKAKIEEERDEEIRRMFPETDFLQSLQSFFGKFFYECYGLQTHDELIPKDIILQIKITYRKQRSYCEWRRTITYDSGHKYKFFRAIISAVIGYKVFNEISYKHIQGKYSVPIIILIGDPLWKTIDVKFTIMKKVDSKVKNVTNRCRSRSPKSKG